MLDVQTTNTPSGAIRFVVPVLVDEADRIDGNPHPDWIFKSTSKEAKAKMEWLFAPLQGSVVFKRLTKKPVNESFNFLHGLPTQKQTR